ncbi:MAG: DNA-directed RNA polymerase subunit alpha [Candidatus Pacebacteria bacterium]|nr:DNA-directed RNA polymerase subunit alpha [Candidatus Paceibacterota bacterium]
MSSQHIVLPSKLTVVQDTATSGTYEIEGLAPGYGHTLGNSLRRIILSSLSGCAVTLVRIEGAQHEFSVLDGVKEDVINIILNLKQVRFRLDIDGPQTVRLKSKGIGMVDASAFELPAGIEVMTPDQHIAEITSKTGSLDIEVVIESGLGFVPKEMHHKEKADIGSIAVDAVFTPIRRMNYEVENMRVGDRTDFNKLRLNIETDGSIAPKEALEKSLLTMLTQIKAVLDLKELPPMPQPDVNQGQEEKGSSSTDDLDLSDVLKTRVDNLNLSTRTLNALTNASIRTIGGIVRKTEVDLLELDGIGAKGVDEIKSMLADYDLFLK